MRRPLWGRVGAVVMVVTTEEGPEMPEGAGREVEEELGLGALGWSGVCWVTREIDCGENVVVLPLRIWETLWQGQAGRGFLQLLQRGDWGGFINWLHGGVKEAAEQGQWEDRGKEVLPGDRRDQKS